MSKASRAVVSGSLSFARGALSRVEHGAAIDTSSTPVQGGNTSRLASVFLEEVVVVTSVTERTFPSQRTSETDAVDVTVSSAVLWTLLPADSLHSESDQLVAILAHAARNAQEQPNVAWLAANALAPSAGVFAGAAVLIRGSIRRRKRSKGAFPETETSDVISEVPSVALTAGVSSVVCLACSTSS